jgi:UDP-glucose 4-epimerase
MRDYVHAVDLAEGHVSTVKKLLFSPGFGCKAINLGTRKGTSVLEMVKTFQGHGVGVHRQGREGPRVEGQTVA